MLACSSMELWFAALLGVVQGLTEFIPISSTAHIKIVVALFGKSDEGMAAYTALLQLGTLAAVIVYFAKDLSAATVAMFRDPSSADGRMPWKLAVATLPIVVAGLLLKKHIEGDLRSLWVISLALIGIGMAMAIIDKVSGGERTMDQLTFTDALIVGLAQTLALVPGVSRSGSTICMLLLLGFTRSDSARFSFLLSIPAIAGAAIFEAKDAIPTLGANAIPALGIGIATAFVTGYLSIAWMLKWLGTHDLIGFAIYRIIAGLALLGALLRGLL
jgi:undecaprenyl-diphosphatase